MFDNFFIRIFFVNASIFGIPRVVDVPLGLLTDLSVDVRTHVVVSLSIRLLHKSRHGERGQRLRRRQLIERARGEFITYRIDEKFNK